MVPTIKAHYLIPADKNPSSMIHKRVAYELYKVPSVGEYIVIPPEKMETNETLYGPGLYRVLRVLPDKKNPYEIWDYKFPNEYWFLHLCQHVYVEPLRTMPISTFRNYVFAKVTMSPDEEGIIKQKWQVISQEGLIEYEILS